MGLTFRTRVVSQGGSSDVSPLRTILPIYEVACHHGATFVTLSFTVPTQFRTVLRDQRH